MRLGDTPVPIPNTTVKTQSADGTALETVWESRWAPDQKRKNWIYQWWEILNEDLKFLMTDKTSVRHVPVHCSSKASLSHSRAGTLWKQNISKAYESKLSTHSKHFVFAMYLENCILKIWYKVQTERFETNIKTSEVLHESVTKQTKTSNY